MKENTSKVTTTTILCFIAMGAIVFMIWGAIVSSRQNGEPEPTQLIEIVYSFDFFTNGLAVLTMLGVGAAAIAYWRQANAQTKQTSELKKQVELANDVHIEGVYNTSVDWLENGETSISWTQAIQNVYVIAKREPNKFLYKTVQLYNTALSKFSLDLERISNDENQVPQYNDIQKTLGLIIYQYTVLLAKIEEIPQVGATPFIGNFHEVSFLQQKNKQSSDPVDPAEFEKHCFENFMFHTCDFEGAIFKQSNFADCVFYHVKNMKFVNCLFALAKESNFEKSENNISFQDCYIFEEFIQNNKTILKNIENGNIKIISKNKYPKWKTLPKLERMLNWDKLLLD